MTRATGSSGDAARLGVFLNGEEIADARRARASRSLDDSFLLLFNAHHEDVEFTLPAAALRRALGARAAHDASRELPSRAAPSVAARAASSCVGARSLVLLRRAR